MAIKINQWIKVSRDNHNNLMVGDVKNNLANIENAQTSSNYYKISIAEKELLTRTRTLVKNEIRLFLTLKFLQSNKIEKVATINRYDLLEILELSPNTQPNYLRKKLNKFAQKINRNKFLNFEITALAMQGETYIITYKREENYNLEEFYNEYPALRKKEFVKKVFYEKLEIKSFPKVGENDR